MVRDVARWIASIENNGLLITSGTSKQKLEVLLHEVYDIKTPMDYFEGMQELKVLSLKMEWDKSISLNALKYLPNLRALRLNGFKKLEGISALAKLTKLEILHLNDSTIDESIETIGELKILKVLDLRCHLGLKFPPNLITRLVEVEELYLGLYCNIDAGILLELNVLRRLVVLWLYFPSLEFPPHFLFPRLQRYRISINNESGRCITHQYQISKYPYRI